MKVTLYGTAAAEGFPAMFCECEACTRARKQGGRNLRTRSEALIDESLLIDMGPDLLTHTIYSGLSLIPVTDVILTHSHSDHLLESNIWSRCDGIGHIKDKKPMNIYCTKASYDKLLKAKTDLDVDDNIAKLHLIEPFKPFEAGKYHITPLKANHSENTDPVVYLINDGNKTFFYCTDTGYFPKETKEYLEKNHITIDAIAIDCTAGILPGWTNSHLGVDTDKVVIDGLKEMGIADEKTKVVLHHFSHNCKVTYDELVPIAGELGYEVAYDGMKFEI